MTILRDTLYTDKVLAVLREYSSNAWDAHRMIGKGATPIKITLPETGNPTLCIRDYGPGMSPDEVFTIFTQYGESTKRNTNDAVGMMGIGSKSAFAYSDSFTVTSWNDGVKRIYVAVLDASNIGEIQCLDESPCDPEETGVEIQVPVGDKDTHTFKIKALNLFQYFDPQPEINCQLPVINRDNQVNGFVSSNMHEWVAIMGCIPYRLNLDQVREDLEAVGLWKPLQNIKGGIYFKIGDVNVSASREELKYTDLTKKAIVAKFTEMVDEHIEKALKDVQDKNLSDWEKRVRANFMTHVIGFKLPKGFTEWAKASVDLWGYNIRVTQADGSEADDRVSSPKTFSMFRSNQLDGAVNSITVTQGDATRLLIRDDPRDLKGYGFRSYDYVIRPASDKTVEEVKTELDIYITQAKLTGVKVELLSESGRYWSKPFVDDDDRRNNRIKDVKHRTKAFRLKDKFQNLAGHHSMNWEVESWVPSDDDVYVALDAFVPKSFGNGSTFYDTLTKDKKLAKWANIPFPIIYGYKDTVTMPLNFSKVKGMEYQMWRAKFFADIAATNKTVIGLIELMAWTSKEDGYVSEYIAERMVKCAKKFGEGLPANHIFNAAMTKLAAAFKALVIHRHDFEILKDLMASVKLDSEATRTLSELKAKYPLMFSMSQVSHWDERVADWVRYITTCDQAACYNRQIEDLVADLVDSVGLPLAEAA